MKVRKTVYWVLLLLYGAALPCFADPVGVNFRHGDWELVCDNTRTCRAAGYQSDPYEPASLLVSVLLTRKAGPSQAVEACLAFYREEGKTAGTPRLSINGRNLGALSLRNSTDDKYLSTLNETQTRELLRALPRKSEILVIDGKTRKKLSDEGAAAVLLKMDEFQGRLDTRGALIRKGKKDESGVLEALTIPDVHVSVLAEPRSGDAQIADDPALRKALLETANCTLEATPNNDPVEKPQPVPLTITRLTENKLLVSGLCWREIHSNNRHSDEDDCDENGCVERGCDGDARDEGVGFWVINDKPPYHPQLVTNSATDFLDGRICALQKKRDFGDCLSRAEWSWDGRSYVKTEESSSGLCKGFIGGAWYLPSIVSDVIMPKN